MYASQLWRAIVGVAGGVSRAELKQQFIEYRINQYCGDAKSRKTIENAVGSAAKDVAAYEFDNMAQIYGNDLPKLRAEVMKRMGQKT